MPEWRYFSTREVAQARAHAASGGIAIHRNLFKLRGHETCHMLASDEPTLIAAALELGVNPARLHRSRTPHFDLWGEHLDAALARCPNRP